MRYQFNPENRAAATTHVFEKHRVSFVVGVGELDDDAWKDIEGEPEIQDMLQTEVLKVLASTPIAAPPASTTPKTTKPKPE